MKEKASMPGDKLAKALLKLAAVIEGTALQTKLASVANALERIANNMDALAGTKGSKHGEPLTAEQVAKILGISPFTVYRLGREGELRRQKIGRSMRFLLKDVEDYQRARLKLGPSKES